MSNKVNLSLALHQNSSGVYNDFLSKKFNSYLQIIIFNCFIVDIWREYTSYDVNLKEEETTEIDLNVISTAGMDVICGKEMAPSTKGAVLLFTLCCIQKRLKLYDIIL